MLVDEGLRVEARGSLRGIRDLATAGVPATIQALLGARLDLQTGGGRAVLQLASAIDEVFTVERSGRVDAERSAARSARRLQALAAGG